MAKKNVESTTAEKGELANVRTSGHLDFTPDDTAAAGSLGIVLTGSLEDRIGRAVYAYNNATRYAVEAGYLLLSVKAEVEHGQFEEGIEALGLTRQRASELMRMAKFATLLPADRRAEMLMLPKSKVLALAAADAEVIADLLDAPQGDEVELQSLSVRELRKRIRELEAKAVDAATERDTLAAERDGLAKKLRRRERDAEDHEGTPLVVADMRAEGAALLKKAELALGGLHPLGVEVVGLASADAADWIKPSLRLVLSGIVALRLQADGLIAQYAKALGDDARKLASQPDALAFLDETEIKTVAEDWARLVAVNQHEAAMRAHERKQAKPRGKGRPEKAPQAPDGV